MDKFQEDFVTKSEELKEKLDKIPDGKKIMGQIFTYAMFKKDNPNEIFEDLNEKLNKIPAMEEIIIQMFMRGMFNKEFQLEIVKVKKQVEKFLQGKLLQKQFENFFNKSIFFKLRNDKNLEALKKHKEELKNALKQKKYLGERTSTSSSNPHQIQEGKVVELVDILINLCEFTNKFIDDLTVELHIRQPNKNFIELDELIQEQKLRVSAPFENFLAEHSENALGKIEHLIKLEKQALRHDCEMSMPPTSSGMWEIFKEWPLSLKVYENRDKLMKALDDANPLLEKVELFIPTKQGYYAYTPSIVKEININHVKIKEQIDKAVDELPKVFDDNFFMEIKEVVIFI